MNKIYGLLIMSIIVASGLLVLTPVVTQIQDEVPMAHILGKPVKPPATQPAQTTPWGITRVNALPAAALVDESSVKVAIVDTGMDLDHPDLGAFYVWGYDYVNNDAVPEDDNGHGTHCAGTIAGINNAIGVVGVSQVKLYICKALNSRGSGTYTQIANAIIGATKGPDGVAGTTDDADVISMSLGGPSTTVELENAVNFALNYGVVVVAATGNEGAAVPSYPAAYPGVIKVGATDSTDAVASFTNQGWTILAPGVSVLSTYLAANYATMSGTSMATPHVAGVCALAWAAHPNYTNIQIRLLVEGSGDAKGIVNALAVV
jgi:subtilisin family serine protease